MEITIDLPVTDHGPCQKCDALPAFFYYLEEHKFVCPQCLVNAVEGTTGHSSTTHRIQRNNVHRRGHRWWNAATETEDKSPEDGTKEEPKVQATVAGKGYTCPNCDDVYVNPPEIETAVFYEGEDYQESVGEDVYKNFSEVQVWFCRDGCANRGDPPLFESIWECGECNTYYTEKEDAVGCCK